MILKITLFLAYKFIPLKKMNKQGGITRSTNKKATTRRLRDEMIFWEEISKSHNEAVIASVRSYILEMIANQL